jgi:fengycin family lipopeptide synthetase B
VNAVSGLLGELRRLGVTLWHDGDRLRYRAPKGVLTQELLEELKRHKDAISAFLADATDATRRGLLATAPIARSTGSSAPLSFAQERLWFLYQFEGKDGGPGAAYNVPAALRLRGTLDTAALQCSLDEIVRRHAILRTRFAQADEGAVQLVDGGVVPMRLVDFTSVPETERETVARTFIETEAAEVFDFDVSPPVRFSLLQLGQADFILVSVLHHLVADGWSMSVLLRELLVLYEAFADGRPSPLSPLPLQYADYAIHQRHLFTGDTLSAALAYWQKQMAGAPTALDLPLDRPRPAQQSYRGVLVRFELDRPLTSALKQLAQDCNASLFMVLLAGYAALLSRYSGQTDVVIGTPVANRDRPEVEALIGLFSNYIPLRTNLGGDPSVRDLVARVRRTSLEGYAHQHLPFEQLVDAAKPERRLGVAPLFQVALVLQNLPTAPLALPHLEVQQIQIDRATAKLDVSMLLEESGGIIRGELECCSDVFEAQTVTRMARHFVHMLGAFGDDPGRSVNGLTLLGHDERLELLDRWSGADAVCKEHGLVHQKFREQVERTPAAIALVAGAERLSYAELGVRVARLAGHLVSLGVAADVRVAVCLPRSADLIVTLLAVLEAGGAYLPLDSAHPSERIARIVADAGAEVLVTTAGLRAHLPRVPTVVCIDRDAGVIGRCDAHALGLPATPGQLAYVIYTSGSTGSPKGVMVEHRAACSLVRALAGAVYARHAGPVDVALVASTVFDASVQQILACLLLGHTLHVVDDDSRQSGELLLDFFENHAVTLADGTPSLLGLLLDAGLGMRPGIRLEHLLIGGESLATRLIERLHAQDAQHRITVTNLYGPTECGVDDTFSTVLPGESQRRAQIPIGRPLSNARVYILDAAGAPVPVGVRGNIWIGGPCLARGYLGQPALTAQAYRPDPFFAGERLYLSGDCGRWTDDGQIEFLGRSDAQVKLRGYRVEPAEIESALLLHPDVKDAVVVVDRSGDTPARLLAYVAPRAGAPTVATLRDHLSTLLPAYMLPSAFMVLDRFPLSASGKVDRARLPRTDETQELEQGADYVEPRGAHEQALAAAWEAVLGREKIGSGDHFFALGGDSIRALQVVSKLRQAGLRLELRDLFVCPTLSLLATQLKPLVAPALGSGTPAGELQLGAVQAAFLKDYPGPKHHFHQALMLAPGGLVNMDALNRAIAALFTNHDTLRMRFSQLVGRWHVVCGPADMPPLVQIVDLRREAASREALRAHAAAAMADTDLARGPLFVALLYRLPEDERLLLAAHHLIVDGVSWRILIEDLETAYVQALAQRVPVLTPPTDAYARWTAGMRGIAEGISEDEQHYWRRVEQATTGHLPLDAPQMRACYRDRVELRIALTQDVSARLLSSAHATYGTRMDDLLLTALGRALAEWAGYRCWRVLLESHGREPLWDGADVSRTVGWFTARYPVLLDFDGSDDIGRQIKVVKEMLRQVPGGGGGYEAAQYLPQGAAPCTPLPSIAFNYLGQLGHDLRTGFWTWVDEDAGAVIAPEAPLVHDIEIIGFVADDRFRFVIGYGSVRFAQETVARLCASLERALVDIVEHTTQTRERELTPSDIDYDGFDIDALDKFMKHL